MVAIFFTTAIGGRASAATTTWNSPFSGTIGPGDTAQLINGASIDGPVTNDGTLQFNLTLPLTGTTTISGTGNVLLTNTGTVTLSAVNSYLGGTTINFGNLVISAGGSISHPSAAMTVGEVSADLGTLTISGGSVSNLDAILGKDAGSTGNALIESGTWSVANELVIGNFGSGSMSVTGGLVTTGSNAFLGKSAGSIGSAIISGGSWNVASVLEVGSGGAGSMTLSGGSISSFDAILGKDASGTGTVLVESGTWSVANELVIGSFGSGSMSVTGGLITTGSSVFIGKAPGGIGSATVSGGTWNVGSVLEVGYGGTGSLTINGGSVTSESGYVGVALGSSGTATVTSGTWFTLGDLNVGFYDGAGTLDIHGAGTVSVNGTLNVGPTGSILLGSGGLLLIGTGTDSGVLAADLANNGAVVFNRSTDSTYGYLMSGTGTVTKLGAGRLTFGASNSYAGGTIIQEGILDVAGSGGIDHAAAAVSIGTVGGSVGGLDVTGGSVNASMIDLVRGSLNLVAGTVTTGSAAVATGTATIGGGEWSIENDFSLGSGGSGSLVITSGVLTTNNTTLGVTVGDVGSAVVTGGLWNSRGNLVVGGSGSGSLDISGSGVVVVDGTLSTGVSGTVAVGTGGTLYIGSGTTSGLLSTNLANDGTVVFNRSDASVFANSMSGSGSVQKLGAGALTFSGSSSYIGDTTISAGSLFVNGQLGATPVTVSDTALLGGEGSIAGIVTVDAGGIVAPGSTSGDIATLSVGGLSLLNGAITQFTVSGTDAGVTYDQITGLGSASLDYDGILQLAFNGSYVDQTTFQLFANFTTLNGNLDAIALSGTSDFSEMSFTDPLGNGLWVTDWSANKQRLEFNTATGTLAVVPEPSTLVIAAAGAGVIGFYRWRRGRRSRATGQGPQAS